MPRRPPRPDAAAAPSEPAPAAAAPGPIQPGRAGLAAALWLALLAALGYAAYANALDAPFVLDDEPSLVANPNLRTLAWPRALLGPPGSTTSGRPLVALSFAWNHAAHGLRVRGYHVTNVALHVAAGAALFGLLAGLLAWLRERAAGPGPSAGPCAAAPTRVPPPLATAGAAAALWVVHPLATDALNHVSYRTEILLALGLAGTLACAVRALAAGERLHASRSPGGPAGSASRRGRARAAGWTLAAVLACALGMASKEPMVVAPLAVLLVDRTWFAGTLRAALSRRPLLYAGLAATWIVLALAVRSGDRGMSVGAQWTGIRWHDYAPSQIDALLVYARRALWPAPLVFDYGPYVPGTTLADVWPGALALAVLGALVLWLAARRRAAGVAGLVALGVLAPSSSVIPLLGEPVAEHRAYAPLMAVTTLVVLGAWRAGTLLAVRGVPARALRGAGWTLLVALVALLALLTRARNEDYRSPLVLWRDTAEKVPDNPRAHEHLGAQYVRSRLFGEAEKAYRTALELKPDASAHYDLATVLLRTGREAEARALLARTRELDPAFARRAYAEGTAYLAAGRAREAVAKLRGAHLVDPADREIALHLATLLATLPDAELRDGAEARGIAEGLVRASGGSDSAALEALAAALAEEGRFEEAVAAVRRALAAAERTGARGGRRLSQRLELYASGQPLRLPPRTGLRRR